MVRGKFLFIVIALLFLAGCTSHNQERRTVEDLPPKQTELKPKEVDPISIQLDEIKNKAKLGLVKDCEFSALNSTIDQVKEKWGEPDRIDRAGSGYYATFEKRGIAFGFNVEGKIFDVRSYSKDLQEITLDEIKDYFESPAQVTEFNHDKIYTYNINAAIQLKFILPEKTEAVDHISVFNQQRSERYLLDIKGNSNQLSASAWDKMLQWRKQIVNFSKGQENVYINGPNVKRVALTFDDGPDASITSAIIDILDKYKVTGNFFFVGSNVEKYPDVVKKAYDKGNIILNHSYNHVDLTKLNNQEIQSQLEKTDDAIAAIIGHRPAILRPPYGETNDQVADIAQKEGYSIVIWSIDTLDWSQKEASNIVKNVVDNVRNGEIILMHSTPEQTETKKALPIIIEELQKKNFEIVGLDKLLNVKAYQ
ncbi:polysaccharide deacetylase family protein [Neobacillus bataviensis]|uniref:polysaccharide deacetylase family protein n=1 Tax=Neobacillus bataviensis TaxID=220685 RepID=UPI001CC19D31|nr:polysaccharide deacetylase family protein [Neobacillus bataviensis]